MSLRNSICHKFERLINDEIAAGQQNDHILVNGLRQHIITEDGKRYFGIPVEVPLTLYDITRPSVDVLSKLRFIYLLSLLEAFGKEYVAARSGISTENVSSHISAEKSAWQQKESGPRASTSFYNTAFLAFVLTQRYSVTFSHDISPCFWEIGPLRNCMVHHQGVITNEVFRANLKSTIAITNTVDAVGEQIILNNKLMWNLIESSRKFLTACDY